MASRHKKPIDIIGWTAYRRLSTHNILIEPHILDVPRWFVFSGGV